MESISEKSVASINPFYDDNLSFIIITRQIADKYYYVYCITILRTSKVSTHLIPCYVR